MQIINIASVNQWEKILDGFNEVSFLQSFRWGEFQEQLGNQVNRVQVIIDKKKFAIVQYYIIKSKTGQFLYCGRGPLATSVEAASALLDVLINKAQAAAVDFIQIEPDSLQSPFLSLLDHKGFMQQSAIQPQHSLIVPLAASREEIYANIRKTTRYLIRKAQEEGVTISSYDSLQSWDQVGQLFLQTSARQKFISHTLSYIKTQFDHFPKQARLYLADIKGKVLSAAIVLSYRKTSAYLHAASDMLARDLGASHLLVWTAIEDAQKKGDQSFDLWGIAPPNEQNHPWSGITVFKQGFAGQTIIYPSAYVLPVNKLKFNFYQFVSTLRAMPIFKTIQRILLKNSSNG